MQVGCVLEAPAPDPGAEAKLGRVPEAEAQHGWVLREVRGTA